MSVIHWDTEYHLGFFILIHHNFPIGKERKLVSESTKIFAIQLALFENMIMIFF